MRKATFIGRKSIMLAAVCAALAGLSGTAMADLVVSFNNGAPTVIPGGSPIIYNVDVIVNGPDACDQPTIVLGLAHVGGTNTPGVIFRGPPSGTTQPATYTAATWNGPTPGPANWLNVTYSNNPNPGGGPGRRFVMSGAFGAPSVPLPNQFIATLNIVIPAGAAIGTYRVSILDVDFTNQDNSVVNAAGSIGQFFEFSIIPEPSSIVLSLVGVAGGLGVWVARRRNSKKEETTVAA